MKKSLFLASLSAIALAGLAQAQLVISSQDTPTVITFGAGSPGVIGTNTAYNGNNGISNSVNGTLSSGVWAARVSTDATFNWNPLADTGTATASYDFFRTSQPSVGNLRRGLQSASGGTSGMGNADISSNVALSFRTSNISASYIYIAVRNTTGSTVNQWSIDYDGFRSNQTTGVATANFVYTSITSAAFVVNGANPTFTSLPSLSFATLGTAAGGGNFEAVTFSAQTINATVANNDYFIFGWQIRQTGNFNETVAFDNISISAIPEPSTWALLALGGTIMVVFRRRRQS